MSSKIPGKQIYKFIDKFDTQPEFLEFARSELEISNREINDVTADHSGSREQKYQILYLWVKKNGRAATLEKLEQLKHNFDTGNEENDEEVQQQPTSSYSEPGRARVPPPGGVQQPNNTSVKRVAVESSSESKTPAHEVQKAFNEKYSHVEQQLNSRHEEISVGSIADQFCELQTANESHLCGEVASIKVQSCSHEDIHSIMRHDNIYQISPNPKGYVLIINNNFRGQEGERIGAKKDVENMNRLWSELGCKVAVKEDLNAVEIRDTLEKVARSPNISAYSFVVVFIMSHGDIQNGTEVVLGADSSPVTINQILAPFSNDRCRALAGKPKLFFLQFCRGCIIDTGGEYLCQDDRLEDLFKSLMNHFPSEEVCMSDLSSQRSLPVRSDMLISYATQSGYMAFRNGRGSWFINAIANIFMKYAHIEHVADLMIRVRSAVCAKTGLTPLNDTINVPCKEMSESSDFLTKKLYLLPGYPRDDILD
ncbi:caspase-3-like [Styela clava]